MGSDREKKTVKQRFLGWGHQRPVFILEWLLPVLAVIFIGGAVWCLYLAGHRDYERLAFVLMPTAGGMLTIWVAQGRFIEQQEREDKRQDARLESEAKMHNERLKSEFEREHERLTAEAQKDRVQRSITQRIDLAEKLASAVEHLSSENKLKQAAGVQEILFQIDDWHTLIESEIAAIKGEGEEVDAEKVKLRQESRRHRQELFDIAYKFDTKNVELLKSRARGLKQRLVGEDDHSLIGLDFSGMVIGWPRLAGKINFRIDLKDINAKGFIMSDSEMRYVDLRFAHLEEIDLAGVRLEGGDLVFAHLEKANLEYVHLEGGNLFGAHLQRANLNYANLEEANFFGVHLEGGSLFGAHLQRANLVFAHLEKANLECAHLEGGNLSGAHLQGVDLKDVYFDQKALRDQNLLNRAEYDSFTVFPEWLDPDEHGMRLVDETEDE